MKTGNLLLIICLGATVCLLGLSTALECYHCQTTTDGPGCGDKDGFDTNMPVSSKLESGEGDMNLFSDILGSINSGECAYCTKAKAQVDGQEFVMRSCLTIGAGQNLDECSEREYSGNKGAFCVCDGDKCNSGTLFVASLPLLAVAAVATLIKNLMQ